MPRTKGIEIPITPVADTKEFIKDITIASSKSGKALEEEMSGAVKKAQENIQRLAEYEKKILSGVKIDNSIYKHAKEQGKAAQEFIRDYNNTQRVGNKVVTKLSDSYKNVLSQIEKTQSQIEKFNNVINRSKSILDAQAKIDFYNRNKAEIEANLKKEAELQKQIDATTKAYENRDAKLAAAREREYEIARSEGRDFNFEGIDKFKDPWLKGYQTKIENLQKQIEQLKFTSKSEEVKDFELALQMLATYGIKPSSEDIVEAALDIKTFGDNLSEAEAKLKQLRATEQQMNNNPIGNKLDYMGVSSGSVDRLRSRAADMYKLGEETSKTSKNTKELNRHTNRFVSLLRKAFTHSNRLHATHKGFFANAKQGFRHLLRNIMRYGIGVRSLYFLFRRLRHAAKEAFKIMAQTIPEVNEQISSLVTNFNLIKANLATMIQPLLRWVVPAFNTVAHAAQNAMEFVGKLFATLTGQDYIYRASAAWVDYAESIGKASKELDNLQKFDELNVIQQPKDNGGGIFSPDTISYEKIEVTEGFFKKLKKAWENADFTEIGNIIATKFKNMLLGLQLKMASIEEFAAKVVTSLATGINGIVDKDTNLGYTIGETIAKLIGIGIRSLTLFLQTVNWKDVGAFIASGLNGFVSNINPEDVADFINTLADSIGAFILGAFDKLKSEEFWTKVKNKFKEVWDNLTARGRIGVTLLLAFTLGRPLLKFGLQAIGTSLLNALGLGSTAGASAVATGGLLKMTLPIVLTIAATEILWNFAVAGGKALEKPLKDLENKIEEAVPELKPKNIEAKAMKNVEEDGILGLPGIHFIKEVAVDFFNTASDIIQDIAEDFGIEWTTSDKLKKVENITLDTLKSMVPDKAKRDEFAKQWELIGEAVDSGFFDGIPEQEIATKLDRIFATDSVKEIKSLLGIHSPSAVYNEIGTNVRVGFLNAFNGFAEEFRAIWLKCNNALRNPINGMISMLNRFLIACQTVQNAIADIFGEINITLPQGIDGVPSGTMGMSLPRWTAPKIPMLAQGAVIPPNKSFLAMLGDQKNGTNVEAPLSTIEDAVRNVLNEIDFTFNFDVNGDPYRIFNVVQKESDKYKRRTGTPAFT